VVGVCRADPEEEAEDETAEPVPEGLGSEDAVPPEADAPASAAEAAEATDEEKKRLQGSEEML